MIVVSFSESKEEREGVQLVPPRRTTDPVNVFVLFVPADITVFVKREKPESAIELPIQGRVEKIASNHYTFHPDFPFDENQTYVIRAKTDSTKVYEKEFEIRNGNKLQPPAVIGIYPTAKQIPSNTLRFYVEFSVPMQRQVSDSFLEFVDQAGVDRSDALMKFKQELWSGDGRRLTVLLDPGRIKRELYTGRDLGPNLVTGKSYRLTVNKGWPSLRGIPLIKSDERDWLITSPIREKLDSREWKIDFPQAHSLRPLRIVFDRTMDRALLLNRLTVHDRLGKPIAGTAIISHGETEWGFFPKSPWASSVNRLKVDGDIEDTAGNRLNEALDHELARDAEVTRVSPPKEPCGQFSLSSILPQRRQEHVETLHAIESGKIVKTYRVSHVEDWAGALARLRVKYADRQYLRGGRTPRSPHRPG